MVRESEKMDLKKIIPWWMKLSLKLLLSLLPFDYSFWRKLGIFKHGSMNNPNIAILTFNKYYEIVNKYKKLPQNFNCLEIGPGDSLLAGLASKSFECNCYWAIDNGEFADLDINKLKKTAEHLNLLNKSLSNMSNSYDFLKSFNIKYRTEGLISLKQVPSSSIDFCWSQVVLEHIFLDQIDELIYEIHRVLKNNSYSVHSIDFRDHLGGSLNNLRFDNSFWESNIVHKGGFYTNRIRPSKMLQIFEKNNFKVNVIEQQKWDKVPIKRRNLSKQFANVSEEDLITSEILLITKTIKN